MPKYRAMIVDVDTGETIARSEPLPESSAIKRMVAAFMHARSLNAPLIDELTIQAPSGRKERFTVQEEKDAG